MICPYCKKARVDGRCCNVLSAVRGVMRQQPRDIRNYVRWAVMMLGSINPDLAQTVEDAVRRAYDAAGIPHEKDGGR